MSEERARILQMVSENKIDAEQAVELLRALKADKQPDGPPMPLRTAGSASWFRVRVTDMATGRTKVNVNLPFGLVRAGVKIGAHFAPEMQDIDWDTVIAELDKGSAGKIVDVEDLESGEKVEVFVD